MSKSLSVKTKNLKPNPWNSNFLSPENQEKLDNALSRIGFFKPIVVRETENPDEYEILGGEHRWESAIRLNIEEVPIFSVGKITDQRAKEITLADNARYGSDDAMALSDIMSDLNDVDIQSFLPYTDIDLKTLFSASNISLEELDIEETKEEDKKPEPTQNRVSKTHQIMRFKVGIEDSEKISEIIRRIQKRNGFDSSDELTNAGDALVFALLSENPNE